MSSKNVLKLMKDKQVEFVDLRFTDPKGKLQHLTMDATVVDEDMLDKGVFFDGYSSLAGKQLTGRYDFKPDLDRPIIDPLILHNIKYICGILDAVKKITYEEIPEVQQKRVLSQKNWHWR